MPKPKIKNNYRDVCLEYLKAIEHGEKYPVVRFSPPSPKMERAVEKATGLHKGQFRKGAARGGKRVSYICHPLSVALLVSDYTDDEDVIIAALLHDTVEDCGYTFGRMEKDFGGRVAAIVKGVTEDVSLKLKMGRAGSWKLRKEKYLDNLKSSSQESMLVASADKIHNLHSLMSAYKDKGGKLWREFNSSAKEKMWFHGEALKILKKKLKNPIVAEHEKVFRKAEKLFKI